MGTIQLAEHLYSVGVPQSGLRIFDIIMPAPYGTSYNAYLLTGEKNVLVETVHATIGTSTAPTLSRCSLWRRSTTWS